MNAAAEIISLKKAWGERLCILAHYYQKDEVCRLADFVGDSYQLALASAGSRADFIVFCGVFFMAEGAKMLSSPRQRVFLPDLEAGCPLADMAGAAEVKAALDLAHNSSGPPVIPVVYVNSSAAVKALCARSGGTACTSSNAALIVRALIEEGKRVFFLPDRNLGINTARRLGLPDQAVILFNGKRPPPAIGSGVKMIVWDGFCNVHVKFSVMDVRKAKNLYPYARILVHPECHEEVVAGADYTGSTAGIIRECEKAAAGDVIFIGTELNLVQRLAGQHPELKVFPLRPSGCVNMNKITAEKLLSAVRSVAQNPSPYEVDVASGEREEALLTLRRMIDFVERGKGAS